MLLFFLLFSFFPNENINNFINPQEQIEIKSFFSKNSISYSTDYDLNYKDKDKEMYQKRFLFSGKYRNNILFTSFDFDHSRKYLSYNSNQSSFLEDNSSNNLELKIGFFIYDFSIIGILNSNNTKITTPGIYLDYQKRYKKIKYKIYYQKYNKSIYENSKISDGNEIYTLNNNYINSYNIWGYNMLISKIFTLNFELKELSVENITPKKNFYFEDSISKEIYKIESKINFNSYIIHYNYFIEIINVDTKGKKDNRQYLKLIVKQYKNSIHKFGIKFEKLVNLDISFQYQKFDSYIYGYIKAWPFTDNSNISLAGGKLNFSSKLNFNRYTFEIKNNFKIKKYYKISPLISFDRIIINPNTKTYEGGSLGIGKKNEIYYNTEIIKNFIHISSLFTIINKTYDLNLYLSQLIPISTSTGGGGGNTTEMNEYGGFNFKFFVNIYF